MKKILKEDFLKIFQVFYIKLSGFHNQIDIYTHQESEVFQSIQSVFVNFEKSHLNKRQRMIFTLK